MQNPGVCLGSFPLVITGTAVINSRHCASDPPDNLSQSVDTVNGGVNIPKRTGRNLTVDL